MRISLRFQEALFLSLMAVLFTVVAGYGGGPTQVIKPPAKIRVAIRNSLSTIQAGGSAVTLHAAVRNDVQSKGVTWTLTANGASCSPTCGTLSDASLTSVTYTPPATAPGMPDNAPTVTATSVADPTRSDSDSFAITSTSAACASSGNESALKGRYAFTLSGYNASGFVASVGSFVADGAGGITAGEVDSNGVLGVQHGSINTSASSYSVGWDNRGCATIVTSFGASTTRFALGDIIRVMTPPPRSRGGSGRTRDPVIGTIFHVATKGRVIEWDEPTANAYIAAGQISRQDPGSFSAGLSGNYVWLNVGVGGSSGNRLATVGVITASAGAFSNGEGDINGDGTVDHFTGETGTYSSVNASGRFTGSTSATGVPTSHFAAYMVSSSETVFVTTDSLATNGVLGGEMKQQSGTFSSSSLSGNGVFYETGLNGGGTGGAASIGLSNANGSGSMTLTSYYDAGGTWHTPNTFTCTYSVASNGRIILSGSGCGAAGAIFYLTAANQGFFLTPDTDVGIGQFESQTGRPFSSGSLSGTFYFGRVEAVNQAQEQAVGVGTLNGSGGFSVTGDYTATTYQTPDQTESLTFTVNSDGTFGDSDHPGVISGIIISSTKFVAVDNQRSTYPAILVGKQ